MSNQAFLVTGASGHLGRRVLELLLAQGVGPIVATTRTPDALKEFAAKGIEIRRADFEDEKGLADAFQGVGRALLISTDALDRPGRRLAQHAAALRAFEASGVTHVVYTSLTNPRAGSPILIAGDHRETEAALAASRLDFTILRNNLYTDLLLQSLPQAIAAGQLVDARGEGAIGLVTREDCARAAAAALAGAAAGRRTLDVTGPAVVTSAEIAAIASELSGRTVQHVSVTPDALEAGLVQHGLPSGVAKVLVSFDVAAQKGELAVATSVVKDLTGHAPQSVAAFLEAHRAALVPARS
ncbi:SDR family oxidoreductase [Polyangium mundeleinium]|uniref:SDR family oxidoreductase n=1 Tax=Polyangium mundeleinium TaxID=2995306 RepID=A0ABT5EPZ2_9BACT|nr:SDR family oxidoreductase [Polyangium mundeleinium]MDC0743893.1 SDR family oxidoreductase [Polyangium mundeleinium]